MHVFILVDTVVNTTVIQPFLLA